jgi:hypothetical protein
MTPQDLIKITGTRQLWCGIGTYSWTLDQFRQCAQFAKAHGIDCLLVKVADGTNEWYGGTAQINTIFDTIRSEGVGMIPYIYSYGNKFGALDAEIDLMLGYMRDSGVVCMNAEVEWNEHTDWGQHLCSRMQGQTGCFMVSTWADPSIQGWDGIIQAMAPCVTVWMPQIYSTFLAQFWPEFAANGATWLQPTVNLTQDFGPNDSVAIAQAAAGQGHTAISVWYYDTAVQNVPLLDAVYAAFPRDSGGQPVNTYSPNSADFNNYFTADANGNWVCKQTNAVIIGGNLALYSRLSIDGNTLPVIGLPRTSEIYQHDTDGYSWSVQFFERGIIVYDPQFKKDGQPGFDTSYIGKYEQFMHLDPNYQPPQTAIPPELATRMQTVATDVNAMMTIFDGLPTTK